MTMSRDMASKRSGRRRAADARTPVVLRPVVLVLVVAGVGALILWLTRLHARNHVTLTFARGDQHASVPLQLTFFPDRLAFAAPSPPPPLSEHTLDGSDTLVAGDDLVPTQAVVRYSGPGIGAGYVHVRLGQELPPITLRPPQVVRGRVGEPLALWCFGWRCPGLRPVAGAEVVVMGGGEHGIPLGSAITDAQGNFAVAGIDGALDGLGVRVRAAGFALANEPVAGRNGAAGAASTDEPLTVVALGQASQHAGQIVAPAGLDPTSLQVLARGLPGVGATPARDGSFALDHVPAGMEPRLIVHGLPPTLTHAPSRLVVGHRTRVELVPASIVRGRVLDAASRRPLGEALVWCGEQDPVRADADGRYELVRQLPGDVDIEAQWDFVDARRRRTQWFGKHRVVLEPDRTHDDVDILVTAR
ncbi:MAG: hypothetical protein WAT39_08525 [Planctomycetota bacterium]